MNINQFYREMNDESERLENNPGRVEFAATMHYLDKVINKKSDILDACAGTGKYAFELAEKGHAVTAGDLVDINVDKMLKIQEEKQSLKNIYKGNILDLSRFEDESFDVVMNLGAYYHMCDSADREESINQILRVLKKGGIIVIAYLNRYANYYGHNEEMLSEFNKFEYYMKNGYLPENELFYASTPELFAEEIKKFKLQELFNIAADGPMFCMRNTLNKMDEETLKKYIEMHIFLCETKSILGMSEHCLYIAKK